VVHLLRRGGRGTGGPTGTNQYTGTRFEYAKNGETVTYALGEQWCWDPEVGGCPTNYTVTYARELRYDGARARYMSAPLNPATMAPYNTIQNPTVWSDYDGAEPYGDFTVSTANPPVVSNTDAYQPGLWNRIGGTPNYLHNDHLGTLRQTTGTTGTAGASRVFTAFGELIAGPDDRFGYVGAWGYQTQGAFPFLHVGARYYDPSSGRFLQRDPIGIRGGINVYAYVSNRAVEFVDPMGLIGESDLGADRDYWKQIEEERRRAQEEAQRRENQRLNTTPYPYDDMQRIIDNTKTAQWWLKVPATIIIWVTPQGKILKWVARGVTACGWGLEYLDLP